MTAASMSDGGEAGPKPDRGEILKALALVAGPCQTIELRALEVRPRRGFPQTFSGYFRDQEQLADAAVEANPYAMGTYVTLNPVDPALFARAPNIVRLVSKHDPLTKDHEIVERHLLLIDVDPKRPAGVSASEAEHAPPAK